MGLNNRGAKNNTQTHHWQLGVLRGGGLAGVFSLLIELGFISNASDLRKVQDKADKWIMEGIYAIWPEYRR